jgi:hypothetical protein
LRFGDHDILGGFRLTFFDDTVHNNGLIKAKTNIHFIPTFHARFNLIDNLLAIKLGVDGNVEYSTYKRIVERNPFVAPNQHIWSLPYQAERYWESYLGVNTMLSRRTDFSVKFKGVFYTNLLNFDIFPYTWTIPVPPFETPYVEPFFIPTYQDVNLLPTIQANLNYRLDDRIAVSAMARVNLYDKEIFNMPKYEANLTARYNIQDKIILRTQLYFNAGINHWVFDRSLLNIDPPRLYETRTLKPMVDWSLGAEYRFNRRWAAFMEFNNILNQRYQHWHNYRSFGTNFLVGATFNL